MGGTQRHQEPEAPIWMPEVGTAVSAYLPCEIVRGIVEKHVGKDKILVRLSLQHPMGTGKAHSYRFNQLVTLHRKPNEPAGERWQAEEN